METQPKIGLFVTALLEDDYNKTGHMRPKMSEATDRIAKILSPYGEVINPGFVEYEPDADKATQAFNAADVDLIVAIEEALGKKAVVQRLPMQPGDVERTFADITRAKSDLGYEPKTDLATGLKTFVEWFRQTSR